jgi:peroxiredoxin
MSLKPRKPVPDLSLDTVAGGRVTLADLRPEQFIMAVFYRGYHCPVCRKYLTELDGLMDEFDKRGVHVVAVSSDTRHRAEQTKTEWNLQRVELAYGLPLNQARDWGLYISSSRGKTSVGIDEPAMFSEPGLFLIRPDGTLYWGNVSTMPFARPHFSEIVSAIDFAVKNDYPARGEVE